jgi:hypothetical protein
VCELLRWGRKARQLMFLDRQFVHRSSTVMSQQSNLLSLPIDQSLAMQRQGQIHHRNASHVLTNSSIVGGNLPSGEDSHLLTFWQPSNNETPTDEAAPWTPPKVAAQPEYEQADISSMGGSSLLEAGDVQSRALHESVESAVDYQVGLLRERNKSILFSRLQESASVGHLVMVGTF